MVRVIAKIIWAVPALLSFLAANQWLVANQLRSTWEQGMSTVATVEGFDYTNRADVTYGYIHLRVILANGQVLEHPKMSLPQSLWSRVKEQDSLRVRVRPGSAQEIVIDRLMPAHWLIAASQAGMSLMGAILSAILAFFWNRSLRRSKG